MKRNLLKLFALTCAMFVNATVWAADPTLSMTSFIIEPGGTYTASIDLVQGDVDVKAFEVTLVLPTGLTIEGRAKKVDETLEEGETPVVAFNADNGKLAVYNNEGLAFSKEATQIVKLTFKAAEDFAGGNIELTNINFSDMDNGAITPANVTVAVTVPAVDIEYPSLAMDNFEINNAETQSAKVALKLVQDTKTKVKAFECEFVLPEGLTVEGRVKAVSGTLEEGETPVTAFNADNGKLAVYNNEGLAFDFNAKEVVNITFKASNEFEGGLITVKNIRFSGMDNEEITAKDFQVKVNVADGIVSLSTDAKNGEAYTLSGTRVRNLQRGLYIVNGKKVVVK